MNFFQVLLIALYLGSGPAHAAPETDPRGLAAHGINRIDKNAEKNPVASSARAQQAPLDLQYIDTMRHHHQAGIELAALADDRAKHARLEKLAQKMVESQRRDLEQLAEWRKAWYAGQPEAVNMNLPGMKGSMRGMDSDKFKEAKGARFDKQFLATMIRHHQGAIEMSRHATSNVEHDALKQFAERQVKTQRREVARMKEWQEAWDGKD